MTRTRWNRSLTLATGAFLLASCAQTPPVQPAQTPPVEQSESSEVEAAEDFCAAGSAQSPIVINPASAKPGSVGAPVFQYQASGAVLTNTGKSVRADFSGGSAIRLDGATFELVEFHFHHPPEHPIAGSQAVLEAHLVHQAASGLAVVGVPIVVGRESTAVLDELIAQTPEQKGWRALGPKPVNPAALVPRGTPPGFRYAGSLTTPPYTECVRWTMYAEPVALSPAAYDRYKKLFPEPSSRPVQPLNGRVLVRVGK